MRKRKLSVVPTQSMKKTKTKTKKKKKEGREKRNTEVISEVHLLTKSAATTQDKNERRKIQSQIDDLLVKYQQESLNGETIGFDSSVFVLQHLHLLDFAGERYSTVTGGRTLSLLDVGAIKNRYTPENANMAGLNLNVTCIDLNESNDKDHVVRADFFDYCATGERTFDIIVLSLVINFDGDKARRGEMLRLCGAALNPNGLAFIVLPLACIDNARYLDEELFTAICLACGLAIFKQRRTAKLFMCVCRKVASEPVRKTFKKRKVHDGVNCNNFCIELL